MFTSKNATSHMTVAMMCLFAVALNPGAAVNTPNSTKTVFYIGAYNLANMSMDNSYYFHAIPYFSKIALESGLLADAVPNWWNFTVEYVEPQIGRVWTASQAAPALPKILGGVMCSDPSLPHVVAVVGDVGSASAQTFASVLGVYKTPHVSPATAESLSQKAYFPYYVRSTAPGSQSGKGFATLCNYFGWLRVTAFHKFEESQEAVVKAFASYSYKLNVSADTTLMEYPKPFGIIGWPADRKLDVTAVGDYEDELKEWSERLASKEPRIFFATDVAAAYWIIPVRMALADIYGMLGPGYVWMLGPATYVTHFSIRLTKTNLEGPRLVHPNNPVLNYDYSQMINRSMYTFLIDAEAEGAYFLGTNWTKLVNEMTPQKLLSTGALYYDTRFDPNSPGTRNRNFRGWMDYVLSPSLPRPYLTQFDSSLSVYAAIGSLIKKGTPPASIKGKTLLDEILKSDFEGPSGRVKFDEKSDRVMPQAIKQLQPGYDPWRDVYAVEKKVGLADVSTGEFKVLVEIKFPGGSTVPPRDNRAPCLLGTEYMGRKIGCADCKPGYYNQVNRSMTAKCLSCGKGQIAAGSKSTSCEGCAAGSIAAASGSSKCSLCPAGSNAAKDGLGACTQCPVGMFSEAGAIKCDLCPKGRYTSDPGMTACSSCKATFSTESRGSVSKDECKCPASKYLNPGDDICLDCIEGLGCPGGNDPPTQRDGYYVEVVDAITLKHDVFLCAIKEWCPQGQLSACADARTGRSCARIAADLDPCPGWAYPLFVIVGLIVISIAASPWLRSPFGSVSMTATIGVLLTITCSAMQAINVHFQCYEEVPKSLVTLDSGSRPFSFKPDMFLPQCGLGETFAARLSLPIVPVLFVGCTISVLALVSRLTGTTFLPMPDAADALGTFLQMMFIPLCKGAFGFMCRRVNPSPVNTLQDFTDVIFGSDAHLAAAPILIAMILLVIIFCVLSVFLFLARVAPNRMKSERFRTMSRFLLGRFHPHCSWWGIIILMRNVCLCLVPIIIIGEHLLRVEAFVTVLLASIIGQMYFMPWNSKMTNIYDALTSLLVCLVALSGLAFAPGSTEAQKERAAILMHIWVGGIVLAFFAFIAYFTIKNTGPLGKKRVAAKKASGIHFMNKIAEIRCTILANDTSKESFKTMLGLMYDYDWEVLEETAKFIHDGSETQWTRAGRKNSCQGAEDFALTGPEAQLGTVIAGLRAEVAALRGANEGPTLEVLC